MKVEKVKRLNTAQHGGRSLPYGDVSSVPPEILYANGAEAVCHRVGSAQPVDHRGQKSRVLTARRVAQASAVGSEKVGVQSDLKIERSDGACKRKRQLKVPEVQLFGKAKN